MALQGNLYALALKSQVPAFFTSKLYCIPGASFGELPPGPAMTNFRLPLRCAAEPAVHEET